MIKKGEHHHHVLILNLLLFTAIMFLFEKPNVLLGLYVLVATFLFLHKRNDFRFFVSVLALGLVVEIFAVSLGVWVYPHAGNAIGVPYWILMMWAVGALSVHRAGEYLKSKMR